MMSTGAAVSSILMSEPACQPHRAGAGSINSKRVWASLSSSAPGRCAGWLLLIPHLGDDLHRIYVHDHLVRQSPAVIWSRQLGLDMARSNDNGTKQPARATCPFAIASLFGGFPACVGISTSSCVIVSTALPRNRQ